MTIKLLTEHHLEFLRLKEAAQAPLSLLILKRHIVGNHMSQLILTLLILMDYPMHVSRIRIVLPILYFKGRQVEIS